MTDTARPEEHGVALRKLGAYERFRVALHDLGFHYSVAVVGIYKPPDGTTFATRSLIFNALRVAILRHPALSVTVEKAYTDNVFFRALETINLSDVVTFRDVSADYIPTLEELLSEEHSRGFVYGNLPLWRVVVLNGFRLDAGMFGTGIAFIYHHVIADGKSGLAMHSTILEIMNSTASGQNSNAIYPDWGDNSCGVITLPLQKRALLPALEDVLSLRVSAKTKISEAVQPWLPGWFSAWQYRNKWAGNPYHCEEPIRTKIRLIAIPPQATRKLVKQCRHERIRVTAFLQMIVGRVLMQTFKNAGLLRCTIAISLRRFFPPSSHITDDEIGLWVDGFHINCSRSQLVDGNSKQLPWSAARDFSRTIDHEIHKGDMDLNVRSVQNTKDFAPGLMAQINTPRDRSYSITNIGLVKFNRDLERKGVSGEQTWRLHQMTFSQSCHVNGSAIQFCIVSTIEGGMAIALNWQEGTVTEADAGSIVVQLKESLLEVGNQSI